MRCEARSNDAASDADAVSADPTLLTLAEPLQTPTTAAGISALRAQLECHTTHLQPEVRHQFAKFANAAEGTSARCALLEHKTLGLDAAVREKALRKGRNYEVGPDKVTSWKDLKLARARKTESATKKAGKRQADARKPRTVLSRSPEQLPPSENADLDFEECCHVWPL